MHGQNHIKKVISKFIPPFISVNNSVRLAI